MTDPLALGEKLLSLLEESARTTTYKPAVLLALIDRVQEYAGHQSIPVRTLAERVIELYWPQTLPYQTTGKVLSQSQTRGRATIIAEIESLRKHHGSTSRTLPHALRSGAAWTALVDRVEVTLAQFPIPRLQRPYAPFLYEFSWSWQEAGGWSVRKYRAGDRAIRLCTGVGDALIALGPLLRPFITRWWTEKAAQLNPDVKDARSVLEFEDFLFGRDRVALDRVAENCSTSSAEGASTATATSDASARSTTSCHGATAATTASTTSSPPATPATTANARRSLGRSTSRHCYSEIINGTATWLPSLRSGCGHETSRAHYASREPPTSTRQTNDHSGCTRTSGTSSRRLALTGGVQRAAAITLKRGERASLLRGSSHNRLRPHARGAYSHPNHCSSSSRVGGSWPCV